MDYDKFIDKLYQALERGEERYSDLAYKAMNNGNQQAFLTMSAQCAGWTQARYTLDELLEEFRHEEK